MKSLSVCALIFTLITSTVMAQSGFGTQIYVPDPTTSIMGARGLVRSRAVSNTPAASLPTPDLEWTFDEGSGQLVFNQRGPKLPTGNQYGTGNQFNSTTEGWTEGGAVATNYFALDPDGDMTATRLTGGNGDFAGKEFAVWHGGSVPATMSVWLKSNTGMDQTIGMWGAFNGSIVDQTVTSTWTKFTYTWTPTANADTYGIFAYGHGAFDILAADAKLEIGGSATPFVDDMQFDWSLGKYGQADALDPAFVSTGLRFTAATQHIGGINRSKVFNKMTVYAAVKFERNAEDDSSGGYLPLIHSKFTDGLFQFGYYDGNTGGPGLIFNNQEADKTDELTTANDGSWHVLVGEYDGTTMSNWIDEGLLSQTNHAPAAVTLRKLEMGSIPEASVGLKGIVGLIRMFNAGHDDATRTAEIADIRTAMNVRGAGMVTLPTWAYFVGDSITDGNGSALFDTFPYQALKAVVPPPPGVKHGIGGAGIADMVADAANVDARIVSTASKNVLTVLVGANDLENMTAASFKAQLKAYCLARRAAGWKIVLLTVLPRNAMGFNTTRNAANVLIRGDSSFYDALGDIGDTGTTMGADAAPDDTMLYQDGTHPTQAGYALLAPIVAAAIQTLF